MKQVPKKENANFKELLTGQLVVELDNFFFRTKLNQVRAQIDRVEFSVEEGVELLYKTCVELINNDDISSKDIETIFKKQEILSKDEKLNEISVKEEKDKPKTINTTDISQKNDKINNKDTDSERKVLEGIFDNDVIDEEFELRIKKYEEEKQWGEQPKIKKENKSDLVTDTKESKEKANNNKRLLTEKRREASIKRRNEEKREEKEKLNNKSKDSSLGSFLKSFLGAM